MFCFPLSRIPFLMSAVWFFKRLEKNDAKPQGALLAVAVHPHSELFNEGWKGLGGLSLTCPSSSSVLGGGCRCFLQIISGFGTGYSGRLSLSLLRVDKSNMVDCPLVAHPPPRGWPQVESP